MSVLSMLVLIGAGVLTASSIPAYLRHKEAHDAERARIAAELRSKADADRAEAQRLEDERRIEEARYAAEQAAEAARQFAEETAAVHANPRLAVIRIAQMGEETLDERRRDRDTAVLAAEDADAAVTKAEADVAETEQDVPAWARGRASVGRILAWAAPVPTTVVALGGLVIDFWAFSATYNTGTALFIAPAVVISLGAFSILVSRGVASGWRIRDWSFSRSLRVFGGLAALMFIFWWVVSVAPNRSLTQEQKKVAIAQSALDETLQVQKLETPAQRTAQQATDEADLAQERAALADAKAHKREAARNEQLTAATLAILEPLLVEICLLGLQLRRLDGARRELALTRVYAKQAARRIADANGDIQDAANQIGGSAAAYLGRFNVPGALRHVREGLAEWAAHSEAVRQLLAPTPDTEDPAVDDGSQGSAGQPAQAAPTSASAAQAPQAAPAGPPAQAGPATSTGGPAAQAPQATPAAGTPAQAGPASTAAPAGTPAQAGPASTAAPAGPRHRANPAAPATGSAAPQPQAAPLGQSQAASTPAPSSGASPAPAATVGANIRPIHIIPPLGSGDASNSAPAQPIASVTSPGVGLLPRVLDFDQDDLLS